MDLIWMLILLAIVLSAMWYVRKFRRAASAFYWPWFDGSRGDRQQQAYIAEEEIKRGASSRPGDRDLAP